MRNPVPLLLLFPVAALAWGETGHRVVCEIAFTELDTRARAEVKRLIDLDPEYDSFAEACNWADGPPRQRELDHFVNLPRSTTAVTVAGCPLADSCLFTAVDYDSAVLANPGSTDGERLAALKLLGHWVGDMHQPLHVSFADDRGANSVEAVVEQRGELVETNLHAVWDYWIIAERLGDDWRAIAGRLHSRIGDADRDQWRYDGPVEWADESFRITTAPATAYCTRKSGACWYDDGNLMLDAGEARRRLTVDDRYAAQHIRTVELRLTQAGTRLGALLNGLLERR